MKLDTACEFVAVKLELKGQKQVTIGFFYRPPWVDDSYMTDFTKTVDNINPGRNGNIWIGGDFNLPCINWETMATPGNTSITQSEILLQSASDHSLTQVVNYDTRKGSTLDLFFSTAPSLVNRTEEIPPLAQGDHDIVFVGINTQAAIAKKIPAPCPMYHKADWESMSHDLNNLVIPEG